ncbi:MAG: DNA-directed RNA polymerase subunit omega [Candidatus Poribacteria bacterium]|nr:DNA-directed RNA polymerase subunit omega [Candidatus Poribacteria bacterium]
MSVVYLEDIEDLVGNKYLAVNVAARRARQLNEKGIPILKFNVRKPASVALQALVEGEIDYQQVDQFEDTSEEFSIFNPVTEESDEDSEIFEQTFSNEVQDESTEDVEEPEEGL